MTKFYKGINLNYVSLVYGVSDTETILRYINGEEVTLAIPEGTVLKNIEALLLNEKSVRKGKFSDNDVKGFNS